MYITAITEYLKNKIIFIEKWVITDFEVLTAN